ncbi:MULTISPECIES: ribosome silencing factor [Caldisericum]|uniref:ribosome silencing factor n=1 Tax=Caldisericum TaxID=693074 RepID=UPI0039FD1405
MKGKTLANFIVKVIEEKKGEDIKVLDVKKLTIITDYFVICTGNVSEHCDAISYELEEKLKKKKIMPISVDKGTDSSWIAMDYGSVIVHIMTEEKRRFYDLERIWEEVSPKITSRRKSKS